MNTLMSGGTGLAYFACSAEECLSWVIILLNILTVFYLVFCSWYKVTKTVKVIGYVWASALTVGTVAVVAIHTCIFTILSSVFTALILMAVLSVVFGKGVLECTDEGEKQVKTSGSYVIHKTDKGNYAFVLYDTRKSAIAKSCFKYNSIEETKAAIEMCRNSGRIAAVEDKTQRWIEFVNHPKFELFEQDGKYGFILSLTSDTKILQSETFGEYEQCKKTMQSALSAVLSDKIYFAEREILADNQFSDVNVASKSEDSADEEVAASVVENSVPYAQPEQITLKESLELAAQSTRKEKITKKYIADYLKSKFGTEVKSNCRANYIKSGKLPLADTHYVLAGKTQACFAFVYEVNETVMLLLKVSKKSGDAIAKGHTNVHQSAFPRTRDKWYSVIIDDSFTNKEVEKVLEESYLQVKERLTDK